MDFYDGGVEPQRPAQSVLATPGTDDKNAHPPIVAVFARPRSARPAGRAREDRAAGARDKQACAMKRSRCGREVRPSGPWPRAGVIRVEMHTDGQFVHPVFGKKCAISGT
ncbi:hypothetical protein GCM10010116_24930 [Microbispora rosea subsp. aerata]|nr:hypothetical protein GCM10010116_24930 [Microbispora rosea subsp. aerata]GIH54055.1 hypothetical protein Mro02_09690 [Microbispora rosea subsp. aerata]GLJ85028.1 hypothetical protein GCM10017588_37560 [Microbispora rosea subsp. aerata]